MKLRQAMLMAVAPLAASLLATALIVGSAGCYDDTCDPECRDGYSCYYGVCLSRGFCSVDDPFAEREPHCVEHDEDGTCTDYRGICMEGYSCECTFLSGDGSCRQRECVNIGTLED